MRQAFLEMVRRRRFPLLALGAVAALLIVGLVIGLFSEQAYRRQAAREAGVQTELLASSVTAALAFDDREEVQATVDQVQVNPRVLAAAVYDDEERLVAAFTRSGETVNPVATPRPPQTTFEDGRLYVVRNVTQAGQKLGTARLRLQAEPLESRMARYSGLGMLLLMALVAVGVLGLAQSALGRANLELRERAGDLTEANRRLQTEMQERAKAEEALRQSQKMEAIGRLTGGIAHDFNNLLMVASSGVDLMDRTTDARKRDQLKAGVKQALERGAALTKQLLAFSRSAAIRPEVLDLRAQIEGMRVLLERSLREDIQVAIDLPDGLWAVEADPNELELALLNLAVNARDAMPDGGVLTVSAANVPAEEGGLTDHVCLSVTDTGTGMSEETKGRVFEPFFTTKEVGKGTGLGLSQVYGFSRSSGGETRIDSELGRGTTVSLCLPRTDKTPGGAEAAQPAKTRRMARGRVLVVEDDDGVAQMVCELLKELGYRTERCGDAEAALDRLARDGAFDLVFSDMVMPGPMDGRALAREVRVRRPDLPVVLTSGFSAAAAEAEQDGFRVLAKPYRIEALGEAIEAARGTGRGRAG